MLIVAAHQIGLPLRLLGFAAILVFVVGGVVTGLCIVYQVRAAFLAHRARRKAE